MPEPKVIKQFECDLCNEVFESSNSLKIHKVSHLIIKPFLCAICGNDFYYKKKIEEHLHVKHMTSGNSIKFFSPTKTPVKKSLSRNSRTVKSEFKTNKCDMCDKYFKHPCNLQRHKAVHLKLKPYLCAICGKSFYYMDNLYAHLHEKHKDIISLSENQTVKGSVGSFPQVTIPEDKSARKYVCEVCNRSFKTPNNLKVHPCHLQASELFLCPLCGLKFEFIFDMTSHLRSHDQVTSQVLVKGQEGSLMTSQARGPLPAFSAFFAPPACRNTSEKFSEGAGRVVDQSASFSDHFRSPQDQPQNFQGRLPLGQDSTFQGSDPSTLAPLVPCDYSQPQGFSSLHCGNPSTLQPWSSRYSMPGDVVFYNDPEDLAPWYST